MRGSELLLRKIGHQALFRRSKFHALMAWAESRIGPGPEVGGKHAATRFHNRNCWFACGVAICGARTAGGHAGDYWVQRLERCGLESVDCYFCTATARTRLDRGSHHRHRISAGMRGIPTLVAEIAAEFVRM